jgi:hypothetical protein
MLSSVELVMKFTECLSFVWGPRSVFLPGADPVSDPSGPGDGRSSRYDDADLLASDGLTPQPPASTATELGIGVAS